MLAFSQQAHILSPWSKDGIASVPPARYRQAGCHAVVAFECQEVLAWVGVRAFPDTEQGNLLRRRRRATVGHIDAERTQVRNWRGSLKTS